MRWPDHLPDGCPPEDATGASEQVYRFVKNDPPTPEDFLSWRELYPNKPCPKSLEECYVCSISVFTSKAAVRRLHKRIPTFKNMKPALGELNPTLGVIKNTPSNRTDKSHHDWWPPVDSKPWTVFNVVDINE